MSGESEEVGQVFFLTEFRLNDLFTAGAKSSIAPDLMVCHECGGDLNMESYDRGRKVTTSFEVIRFTRNYGFCPRCVDYVYPADVALGLHTRAPASPKLQEICALTALRSPAGQAQNDILRLTGIRLDASTLHQEARRQGERALKLRDIDEGLTQTPEGVAKLASHSRASHVPFTPIIEIDAWNIRERDNWGQTRMALS